jgi:predicted Fe-S protein YdhL (DUF1289 family)
VGCGRSLDEIARWAGMTAQEQWSVIDRLERRRREQSTSEAAQ